MLSLGKADVERQCNTVRQNGSMEAAVLCSVAVWQYGSMAVWVWQYGSSSAIDYDRMAAVVWCGEVGQLFAVYIIGGMI